MRAPLRALLLGTIPASAGRPKHSHATPARPRTAPRLAATALALVLLGTACEASVNPISGSPASPGASGVRAVDPDAPTTTAPTTPTIDGPGSSEPTPTTAGQVVDPSMVGKDADPGVDPDPDGAGVPETGVAGGTTGGQPQQPEHPVPPAPVPGWDQVVLAPVAATAADQLVAPPALPDPVPVGAVGPVGAGAPGGLTGNAVGCAATCLVSALLGHQRGTPDLTFDATTNVATDIAVWIRTQAPVMTTNGPRYLGRQPSATSPAGSTSWSTVLGSLQYGTKYHVLVRVRDQYGNEEWAGTQVTTQSAPGPGQLTGNATGCAVGCISSALVTPGGAFHRVHLAISTDTPATISVAVSTSQPGTIGEAPVLPKDETFAPTSSSPTSLEGDVVELAASTTYHVLVRAEDVNGSVSYALGEFTTAAAPPPPPVFDDIAVTFERVEIQYDGDPEWRNRGEASITWGVPDVDLLGFRDFEKIDDGDVIGLPADAGTWFSLPEGGVVPLLVVNVNERDFRGIGGDALDGGPASDGKECNMGHALRTEPFYNDPCDTRTSVAVLGGVTAESIGDLMPCTWFEVDGATPDEKCFEVYSTQPNGDYAAFKVLISFRVL